MKTKIKNMIIIIFILVCLSIMSYIIFKGDTRNLDLNINDSYQNKSSNDLNLISADNNLSANEIAMESDLWPYGNEAYNQIITNEGDACVLDKEFVIQPSSLEECMTKATEEGHNEYEFILNSSIPYFLNEKNDQFKYEIIEGIKE